MSCKKSLFGVKIVLLLVLSFSVALADFYIVNGDKKVKMTSLTTGKIDFATFNTIAHIQRGNEELHAMGDEVAFNHRHLNFRLSTIGLVQTNYTITEWSEKAKEASDTYYINFDDYSREDGVMLQLFYKNRWYAVVLGEPLIILQELFSREDLDVRKALKAIKRARQAYPHDELLQKAQKDLEEKRANQTNSPSKYSTPDNKPIKVFFN